VPISLNWLAGRVEFSPLLNRNGGRRIAKKAVSRWNIVDSPEVPIYNGLIGGLGEFICTAFPGEMQLLEA
jgi:hypothetical protein